MKKILFPIIALFALVGSYNALASCPSEMVNIVAERESYDVKFWGIPFGSSMAKTKELMLSKEGTKAHEGTKRAISFENTPKFAGFNTSFVACYFTDNDELAQGFIDLRPSSKQQIFRLYSSVKDLFQKKYGAPEADYSFFRKPYKSGDGYEVTAIKDDKCVYAAFWKLNEGEDTIYISIEITKYVEVRVTYEQVRLNKKRIKDIEQDAMDDI